MSPLRILFIFHLHNDYLLTFRHLGTITCTTVEMARYSGKKSSCRGLHRFDSCTYSSDDCTGLSAMQFFGSILCHVISPQSSCQYADGKQKWISQVAKPLRLHTHTQRNTHFQVSTLFFLWHSI
uniref:Uncharacterized protein n=1 Tax=Lates calcarifer TaxID=8187 RepID=A0A4W6DVB7_LATCA